MLQYPYSLLCNGKIRQKAKKHIPTLSQERNERMNYQVFSENEWVYPDSKMTAPNQAKM